MEEEQEDDNEMMEEMEGGFHERTEKFIREEVALMVDKYLSKTMCWLKPIRYCC